MAKKGWIIFVASCALISLLGLLFLLFNKEIYIPGFINDSGQNIIVNGWPIVVIGIAMFLFGLLIKWSVKNDRSNNKVLEDPPPTELIEKNRFL